MYRFYVSPTGTNAGCGSKDRPFATLEQAQSAVRALIAAGLDAPVTVTVAAGEYRTNGLVFDACDSGTEAFPIVYEAEGKAIINGGVTLKGPAFMPLTESERARLHGDAKEKVVRFDLTTLGLTRADWGEICALGSHGSAKLYDNAILSPMWCELFFNDKRCNIARYPDEDFLFTEEPVRGGDALEPTGLPKQDPKEWYARRNPLGDIRKIDKETALRVQSWKSLENVWLYGYPKYGWADDSTPVLSVNPETCEMETQYVSMFGIKPHAPYYFFNVFEELDAPGEWFLDRENGILYLYPPSDLASAEILLSITTDNLIRFDGASHITLKGFTFLSTRNDALNLTGDDNTVDACEVKNIAGNAMIVTGSRCTVKSCHIHHTSRGGVLISGGDRNTLTPSGNIVENNHIHHIAEIFRTYNPGVRIDGVGCVVRHNCIHDSAHMAIGFSGNEHVMEFNEIYEVCKIADDSSAIYAGRDYTTCGNTVRFNYFHDMKSDADSHIGIFGMYCDDNLGSCTIFGNVFLRCQSALLLHGGHDMVFKNNLIVDSCPKSHYSIRFHRYGYCEDLLPDGSHWAKMNQLPWQGEVWSKAYPHLAEYVTWDVETVQNCPHYCAIENNIIINHKPIDVMNFNCMQPEYKNTFRNNLELPDRAFAGIPEGDTLDLSGSRLAQIVPGFEEIPLEKMGLLK